MNKGGESRKQMECRTLRAKLQVGVILTTMVLTWAGCGSVATNEAYDMMASSSATVTHTSGSTGSGILSDGKYYEDMDVSAEMEKSEVGSAQEPMVDEGLFDERKLIKTVNMDVETKEYDRLLEELKRQVSELGGYIERMDTYNGSRYYNYRDSRSANMTIRIPKDRLEGFLDTVSGISNVIRRSDNVEDVTLAYVDMESRKNALETEEERLLALLKKADSINDIIVIEERLSSVRYQLESMESQLRTIDNQVDYSTVYLDINEVQELTPIVEQTPLERIGEGFVDSLHDIGDGAVEFAIWFVVNIPYFVVWALIIVLIVFVVRVCIRRKKAKKALKNQGIQKNVVVENRKE